jgi:hypothetical protein
MLAAAPLKAVISKTKTFRLFFPSDADRDGLQRYQAFGLTSSIAGKGWRTNAAHLTALRAVAIA